MTTTTQAGVILRHLRTFVATENPSGLTDRQLLEQFATRREEAAFEALVRRHAPLVFSVCRRVLHNEHDAEDAFQATFLVLARKARGVGRQGSVAGWLHRVAYHAAIKARARTANRERHERQVPPRQSADLLAEVTGREFLAVLDEQLQQLSENSRTPLVLCYLQGHTCDDAARQLGCSVRTLKRRLEQGRNCLRARLSRRGIELPAALLALGVTRGATAGVPATLTAATVKAGLLVATGQTATGVASAQAAAPANGAIRAMMAGRLKTVGAFLLTIALLGTGAALLKGGAPGVDPTPLAAKEPPKGPAVAPATKPAPEAGKKMAVTGRVLGADGKPVPGASVAVIGRPKRPYRSGDPSAYRDRLLAEGKADAEGRFRLLAPRTSSAQFREVYAIAAAEKHAPGWKRLSPDAKRPDALLTLPPEQVIRGSFVDLRGLPAAGVKVSVSYIGKMVNGQPDGVALGDLLRRSPWPEPVTTDEKGRFVIRRCNRDQGLVLVVNDDRFATQSFEIDAPGRPRPERKVYGYDSGGYLHVQHSGPNEKGQPEVLKLPLAPAQAVEGRVIYADTGKPVAKASVSGTQTDADGRFRLRFAGHNAVTLEVFAPAGEPYLSVHHRVQWAKGTIKQQVTVKLPRGVLARGKVTEAGNGKPVAGAGVQFWPREGDDPNRPKNVLTGWSHSEVTKDDGTFQIAVLPGPGHLLIQGPTPDYIHEEIGHEVISSGRPGGMRMYPDAIVKLDLPPKADPKEVAVTLRRGGTVRGRLLGPDGKPVAKAVMLHRLHIGIDLSWHFAGEARDGVFEVHGLDPEKAVPVYFLDAENQCGATVRLSGKQAGETVTVKLAPCGKATARYVDSKGQPMAGYSASPDIVITAGASGEYANVVSKGELLADTGSLTNLDRHNYWDWGKIKTDAEGRVTFPALIPGATYRVARWEKDNWVPHKEFTVASGETVDLGDIPINSKSE